jgi:flagellar motor protein MotB
MNHEMRREQHDFAHSFTDMMSGLAAIFLLVAVLFIVLSASAQRQVRQQADKYSAFLERDKHSRRIASELEEALRAIWPPTDAAVQVVRDVDKNPLLILVLFKSDRTEGAGLFFGPGSAEISREARTLVAEKFPVVFDRLCPRRTDLESIVLEGHTDTVRNFQSRAGGVACDLERRHEDPRCAELSFNNNVVLSAHRAQNVFFQARSRFIAMERADLVRCLDEAFSVAGRGEVDPAGEPVPAGQPDPASRRVVLKIKVKPALAEVAAQ